MMESVGQVLSPAQSRGARGLLDLSQAELASRSNLSESTIRDFEKGRRVPTTNNLAAIQRALEEAGVEFIPENGGGAGVRLKYNRQDVRLIGKMEGEGGIVGDDDV